MYLTPAELRALEGLEDPAQFPDPVLERALAGFEALAEDFCGFAFEPRTAVETRDGNGSSRLVVPILYLREVTAATIDGVAVPAGSFVVRPGKVIRTDGIFPLGDGNVVLEVSHGLDGPDADLKRAAGVFVRLQVLGDRSSVPERAVSMSSDVGDFTLSLAGPNRPTGIPSVDAALVRRRQTIEIG